MVNARFDDEAGVLTRHDAVHVGIATQTPAGLVVPVVRDAQAQRPLVERRRDRAPRRRGAQRQGRARRADRLDDHDHEPRQARRHRHDAGDQPSRGRDRRRQQDRGAAGDPRRRGRGAPDDEPVVVVRPSRRRRRRRRGLHPGACGATSSSRRRSSSSSEAAVGAGTARNSARRAGMALGNAPVTGAKLPCRDERSNAMKLHCVFDLDHRSALACGAAVAMTGEHVAVAFRGDWVPAKAACTSPLKLVIDANVVTVRERCAARRVQEARAVLLGMGQGVQDVTLRRPTRWATARSCANAAIREGDREVQHHADAGRADVVRGSARRRAGDRRTGDGPDVVGVRHARNGRAPAAAPRRRLLAATAAAPSRASARPRRLGAGMPAAGGPAPARVRSASFQFSGRSSRCVDAEPVVIDVPAYAADGRADVADAHAGSRIAQLSAQCGDNAAFAAADRRDGDRAPAVGAGRRSLRRLQHPQAATTGKAPGCSS